MKFVPFSSFPNTVFNCRDDIVKLVYTCCHRPILFLLIDDGSDDSDGSDDDSDSNSDSDDD